MTAPTPTPTGTRASEARVRIATERRAETRAAARETKVGRYLSDDEARVIADRLHRGIGAGSSSTSRGKGASVDEETFTPKINETSRKLAAKYWSKVRDAEGETSFDVRIDAGDGSPGFAGFDRSSANEVAGAERSASSTSTHEKLYRAGLNKLRSRHTASERAENASPSPNASRLDVERYALASMAVPGFGLTRREDSDLRALRERDELKELNEACTFAPEINAKSKKIGAHVMPNIGFLERSKVWAMRKDNVLEAEREARRDEEIAECTFGPKATLTSTATVSATMSVIDATKASDEPPTLTPSSLEGMKAYVARQESARKMREEKNAVLAGFTGATWRNEKTVPVEFTFATASREVGVTPTAPGVTPTAPGVTPTAPRPASSSPTVVAANDVERTPPNLKSNASYAAARARFFNARKTPQ